MALDPTDPGAMAVATVTLTKAQVCGLANVVEAHLSSGRRLDAVRVEKLRDAWARAVLIGPEGDPVDEQLLPPV